MPAHFKFDIDYMRYVAKFMNGRCLSKEYWDISTPLTWQCEKGHTWDVSPRIVLLGKWCPVCIKELYKEEYLEQLRKIAKSKGGECLAKEYVNSTFKLKFRCKQGHEWLGVPAMIKSRCWCRACAGLEKLTIDQMIKLAKDKGGKCLSKKYVNNTTNLKWQCNKRHIWDAVPKQIKKGAWCPMCSFKRNADRRRTTIEHVQKIARQRGGKCLSKKYIHRHQPLKWQCSKGHVWKARGVNVLNLGSWCPQCWKEKIRKHPRDTHGRWKV